jgi:hypothetical protein
MCIYLITDNFYLCIVALFLKYTFSEGWISPSISMIQQVIDSSVKGVGKLVPSNKYIAISVFLFTTTITGAIATVVVDKIISACDAYTHLQRLGFIMVGNTCIPYAISIVCFYFAGKHYTEYKKCLHYCKTATLANVNLDDYKDFKVIERKRSVIII